MMTKTKGIAGPDDVIVGRNLRIYRGLKGVSQEQLAEAIGVTFQQVQKYEKGTNRISLSMAFKICDFLGIEVEALRKVIVDAPEQPQDQQVLEALCGPFGKSDKPRLEDWKEG